MGAEKAVPDRNNAEISNILIFMVFSLKQKRGGGCRLLFVLRINRRQGFAEQFVQRPAVGGLGGRGG